MSGNTYYAPVFNPPQGNPTAVADPKTVIVRQGDALVAVRYGRTYTFYPAQAPNCAPLPTHTYETVMAAGYPVRILSPYFQAWHTCYNDTVAQVAAVRAGGGRLITRDGVVLVDFPPRPAPFPAPPPAPPVPLPPAPPDLPPVEPPPAQTPARRGALTVVLAGAGILVAMTGAALLGKSRAKR